MRRILATVAAAATLLLLPADTHADAAKARPAPVLHMPGTADTEPNPQTFAPDGAWCWFGDSRAIDDRGTYPAATRNRAFYGWITRLGDIQVAQYDRDTHTQTAYTVAYGMVEDDHNNPSLISLPDGRLMIFWTGHAQPGVPIRYRISTNAESVLTWGPVQTIGVQIPGHVTYTYPNPVYVPEEQRLYLFWRAGTTDAGTSNQDAAVTWTDNLGASWAPAKEVLHNPIAGARPYIKYSNDGDTGINIAYTDDHPDNPRNTNNVYYARLHAGTFEHANGSPIQTLATGPIAPAQGDLVHSQAATGTEGWVWDVSDDANHNPVIALADFPSLTNHRYRYASWSPTGGWTDRVITTAGPAFEGSGTQPYYSGGLSLDHENTGVIYLSRKVGSYFEIERWVTTDQGATWASSPITSGSIRDNVRPIVVRGGNETGAASVLWMAGPYQHYTDYDTSIVGFTDLGQTDTISRIRSSVTPASVPAGSSTVVGARLVVDATGALIPGQPVELWYRLIGSTSWVHLIDGTTDATGYAGWTRYPSGSVDYEIRYRGVATITPTTSPRQLVTITSR